MKRRAHIGFTLLELLIVIGIMGLLGTVSVSGFRGLKKGMEQRAAKQVVDQFVRAAYLRAVIDRTPTAVYFWNETISDETVGKKLVVVGRAVAVRRSGRISAKSGQFLIDEFGDLSYEAYRDENGNEKRGDKGYQSDPGRYIYKVGDTKFARSVVSSSTVYSRQNDRLMSRPGKLYPIKAYGYYVKKQNGVTWNVGDPYGFEFADLTLPKNYIFESSYSEKVSDPEKAVDQVMVFTGSGKIQGLNSINIYGLQLDKSGAVAFQKCGTSKDPRKD